MESVYIPQHCIWPEGNAWIYQEELSHSGFVCRLDLRKQVGGYLPAASHLYRNLCYVQYDKLTKMIIYLIFWTRFIQITVTYPALSAQTHISVFLFLLYYVEGCFGGRGLQYLFIPKHMNMTVYRNKRNSFLCIIKQEKDRKKNWQYIKCLHKVRPDLLSRC